ncbi:universal stress protein [Streptomyces avidinii]|uniref:Nucleotide-binding universal stress UspA family protein n=1 Tax=Streptomyces avidinii TaxID=1895 RepID=A0ABS4LGC9_STRAV|nr:universal stress protein [Streptomyces avidinii]MBP2041182.1 nucleotide-binding universal stress UspA family protein [Streptomyces avidinii]
MRGRVVAGSCGSLGSLTALHRAAAEARARDAELWVVLAWQPPIGGPGSRGSTGGTPLLAGCRDAAVERLRGILDTAFGASPPGVHLAGLTVRATPGAALVDTVRDPGDLLVVGTGSRAPLLRALRPSVARYCLAHAPCPVLAVPPSPLQADLDAVHRRNVWRRPLDAGDLTR